MSDILEEKDFQNQKINPQTWKIIFQFAFRRRKGFIIILFGGLIAGLMDLCSSLISMWAIDGFMTSQALNTPGTLNQFWIFITVILGVQLIMVLSIFALIRSAGHLEAHLSSDMRHECFRKLQELSFSYFDNSSVGYLLSRLTNDVSRIMEMISWTSIDLGWGLFAILLSMVAMFVVNWQLALITVCAVPVIAVVSIIFQKHILKYQRASRKFNSMITSSFNEGITGAQTTKTLVREELNNSDFFSLTGKMKHASMRAAIISAVYLPIASVVISLVTGIVLIKGGYDVLNAFITVGELNFFINIGGMMFEPIRGFANIFAELQSCQAAAERVTDVITSVPAILDKSEVTEVYGDNFKGKRENWEPVSGDVEFENVTFWYKEGEPILKNFSLKVSAGENIALVGETGGGKSTIVNLVCRFYEPKEGRILIGGKDIRERSQLWLQSSLGYVLQTPHLFSGSIRENIRYGNLDATDEEVEAAAKLVGAHDFITKLENGYDTDAGEGGNLMSTGQKQLISFARAIIANPAIFVLDEATSSIDTEAEMKIQTAVETLLHNRTSFIIAHRLSTVRNADRILVIDAGEVVEEGTHKELMSKKGRYFDLYMGQFRSEQLEKSMNILSGAEA